MFKVSRILRIAAVVMTMGAVAFALSACGGGVPDENEQSKSVASASGETFFSAEGEVALKAGLEESGFIVGAGRYYEFDTIEGASEGKLMSCFGNNAGSSYTILDLPNAPGQEVPNPVFPPEQWQYKLRQDEAIVLITRLPDECRYYSFIDYVMFTEAKEGKDYSSEVN